MIPNERDPHHDTVKRRWIAIAVAAVLLSVGASLFGGALRGDIPTADSTVAMPLVTETTVVPKAEADVSVLVAFSPNSGEPIELWLGEPTE